MSILFGQAVSIFALSAVRRRPQLRILGLAALLAQVGAFSVFTYAPPHLMLFKDARNGLYGLSAYDGLSHHRAE
jgi:predicted MFS family arabinose efflux permease